MNLNKLEETYKIMNGYFGKDNLLSLATCDGHTPSVRIVDAFFEDGSFYVITYAMSDKMKQISINSKVAVCSNDWFMGHGIAESLGYIYDEKNKQIAEKLKIAFAAWYDNGHNNYDDENTIILCVKLTDCSFYHDGQKCEFDFTTSE